MWQFVYMHLYVYVHSNGKDVSLRLSSEVHPIAFVLRIQALCQAMHRHAFWRARSMWKDPSRQPSANAWRLCRIALSRIWNALRLVNNTWARAKTKDSLPPPVALPRNCCWMPAAQFGRSVLSCLAKILSTDAVLPGPVGNKCSILSCQQQSNSDATAMQYHSICPPY